MSFTHSFLESEMRTKFRMRRFDKVFLLMYICCRIWVKTVGKDDGEGVTLHL